MATMPDQEWRDRQTTCNYAWCDRPRERPSELCWGHTIIVAVREELKAEEERLTERARAWLAATPNPFDWDTIGSSRRARKARKAKEKANG